MCSKFVEENYSTKLNLEYINDMINGEPKALIHFALKNDDLSKRIDYVSDDENDPVVLELDESNYHELAYTYLNWKNGGGYLAVYDRDTGKAYIGYTDHSIAANGRKNIYVSAFDPILGYGQLEDITDENELAMVKDVLAEIDRQSRES